MELSKTDQRLISWFFYIVPLLCFSGCSGLPSSHAASPEEQATRQGTAAGSEVLLSSAGRVEGRTPTVEVGAGADGVIRQVFVRAGQSVNQGDRLAEIDCGDRSAELRSSRADLESAMQARVHLANGSRPEERQIAEQKTEAAKSVVARAAANFERMKVLQQKDDVPRASLDDAERSVELAQAELKQARQYEHLVNAGPLPEELAKADAEVAAAENRVRTMEERVRKCMVVSPIAGTVLEIIARPGESFSTVTPRPLFTISDLSQRRVRAEVDERDVLKVKVGQRAVVFADSRPNVKFSGAVSEISQIMGRKRILLTDPSDTKDRDVLETLVDLDNGGLDLPVGMRVIAQFLR
jgi:HlyD family secretion protein